MSLTGPDIEVGAELGRRAGRNLFHSFERFGVDTGGRVTFTGPTGIGNVISRVTGGERSTIDGTLASSIPDADFYFINPAGILFGPNARIDVPASFHGSTADELRFADGSVFSAIDPAGSGLTVAAPQAFGFLGARPKPIDVQESALIVAPGATLLLAGGDLTIVGGATGFQLAPEGRILLSAHSGAGETEVATGTATGATSGSIRLTDYAQLQAAGEGGGSVRLTGGEVSIDGNSSILAVNLGSADARGGIQIEADRLSLSGPYSALSSASFGTGSAGSTIVDAGSVEIADGAVVGAITINDLIPTGGPVRITADSLELRNGASVNADTFTDQSAGDVDIAVTGTLRISGGGVATAITANAQPGSTAAGGTVRVQAGSLAIENGGIIGAGTFGSGKGGAVEVRAAELDIVGDGQLDGSFTGITSQSNAKGDAGTVLVEAGSLTLRAAGEISSGASAGGAGGPVTVLADRLLIDGSESTGGFTGIASRSREGATGGSGQVNVQAGQLELRATGAISSSTFSAAPAGSVQVDAGNILIVGNGRDEFTTIASQSRAGALGNAGTVTVTAEAIDLQNRGTILTNTEGDGDAGAVLVTANIIALSDLGAIGSSTLFGSGAAGSVDVEADQRLTLQGGLIETNSATAGAAGRVVVRTASLLVDGGRISSNATADGPAGTVTVSADTAGGSVAVLGGGGITTNAEGAGAAGTVTVSTAVMMVDGAGSLVGSTTSGQGDAGTVSVSADSLVLSGSGRISSDTSAEGDAGQVGVTLGSLQLTDGQIASAAAAGSTGDAGVVTVHALGMLTIGPSGVVSASTAGPGVGGAVSVVAADLLQISGGSVATNSLANGLAGDIMIAAPRVELAGGAISSTAAGTGAAGTVRVATGPDQARTGSVAVTAGGQVTTSTSGTGPAGQVAISTGTLTVNGSGSLVASATSGGGAAGSVAIDAVTVRVGTGGRISSDANPGATGAAGAVTVAADEVVLGNGGQISAGTAGAGEGGTVAVSARQITVARAGSVGSATSGSGDAGDVLVSATQELTVTGGRIESGSSAAGRGGDVRVAAPKLTLQEQGEIAASGSGSGAAGSVVVRASRLDAENASIRTEGTGAEGGRIDVAASDRIYLRRAEVTSNGIEPQAGASVISLRASEIILNASTVTSLTGTGAPLSGSGEAQLAGELTVISADSLVAGSSSVDISGLQTDLGSDLQLQPGVFIDVSRLLRESCAATGGGSRSSFTRGGRGGLPASPDRPLPSAGAQDPNAAGTGATTAWRNACDALWNGAAPT